MDIQNNYNKLYCWQYDIRLKNKQSDLYAAIFKLRNPSDLFTPIEVIDIEDLQALNVDDFNFQFEEKKFCFDEVKKFIEKHEWLGRMSLYPTHIFTARYKGLLCGVVVMDKPNAFSNMLGKDTRKIERLISRGACISFSPKNLASKLIMFSIRWMVKNTQYRLFTAYADPEARELGTIYQACNFYYLGQKFGAKSKFRIENGNLVSDRYFRARSVYKRLAKRNNIEWLPEWQTKESVHFDRMPKHIASKLKELSEQYMKSCETVNVMSKHKYAYMLGKTKGETKELRRKFLELNKLHPYPKERGK